MPTATNLSGYAKVTPDDVQGGLRPHAIIFTGKLLCYDQVEGRTHRAFYNRNDNPEIKQLHPQWDPWLQQHQQRSGEDYWFDLYDKYLFGRVGDYTSKQLVLSFWGTGATEKASKPMELIPPCVQQLLAAGIVDNDTVVVYGDGRVATVRTVLAGKPGNPDGPGNHDGPGNQGQPDKETAEHFKLMRKLHLATGAQKQAIMRKLGVGGPAKKNPWTSSMQQNHLLSPGHQYWRMSSESSNHVLELALAQYIHGDHAQRGREPARAY